MVYYSTELFIFDKEKEEIFSFFEFLYLYVTDKLPVVEMYLDKKFYDILLKNENNKNDSLNKFKENLIEEENKEIFFDNKKKNYYKEFFEVLKIEKFEQKIEIEYFFTSLINTKFISLENFCVFLDFSEKGYYCESGKSFGLDLILYRKKDEIKHIHSDFGIKIIRNSKDFNYKNIAVNIRIAKNTNKKLIYCFVEYKNHNKEFDKKLKIKEELVEYLKKQFAIHKILIKKSELN